MQLGETKTDNKDSYVVGLGKILFFDPWARLFTSIRIWEGIRNFFESLSTSN